MKSKENATLSQLPLNINIKGKRALIVGGGEVACRKLKTLLAAGAAVYLVAPDMVPEITTLLSTGEIEARVGKFEFNDLKGAFLIVAATDDHEVNKQIALEATQRGILVAVTDAPDNGNCTFPAVLRRGGLEISVSTGGRSPAFASLVRDVVASVIGEDYGVALERVATEREKLLTERNGSTYNKKIMYSIAKQMITALNKHKESL